MAHRDTAEVIKLFNDSFLERDAAKLVDLIGDDCVIESAQPAPNGTRYEAYDACLRFWQELIADQIGAFEPEDVLVLERDRPASNHVALVANAGNRWQRIGPFQVGFQPFTPRSFARGCDRCAP
jgi:hypothetical protein